MVEKTQHGSSHPLKVVDGVGEVRRSEGSGPGMADDAAKLAVRRALAMTTPEQIAQGREWMAGVVRELESHLELGDRRIHRQARLRLVQGGKGQTADLDLEGVGGGLDWTRSETLHSDASVSIRIHQSADIVNKVKAKSKTSDPELKLGRLLRRVARLPEQEQDNLEEWLDQARF